MVRDSKEVTDLRHLQLKIQPHIKAREGLGHPKKSYGSFQGQILLKLLPNKLQDKWEEDKTIDITDIE
jgi:hypothetical protein